LTSTRFDLGLLANATASRFLGLPAKMITLFPIWIASGFMTSVSDSGYSKNTASFVAVDNLTLLGFANA
jgi:hypothetical protein